MPSFRLTHSNSVLHDDSLFRAIKKRDRVRLVRLLKLGHDANASNEKGQTALLVAAQVESLVIACVLLEAGADPNIGNAAGWTPLMSASLKGLNDLVVALIAKGANVRANTLTGQAPLDVATVAGQDGCAVLLIDAGAPADSEGDDLGYTPIIFASGNCDATTVQLLLDKGADPNRETVDHITALRLAEQRGRKEIVALLKKYGAVK